MVTPIAYPDFGGLRHDFSSIELKLGTVRYKGFKALDYSWDLTPALVRGAHPDPLGQTLGIAEYAASLEVFLAEYNAFLAQQGAGFATIPLTVSATYSTNGYDTIVDTLLGCRLASGEASMTAGSDPLTRKIKLSPLKIMLNGVDLLAQKLNGQ